MKQERLREELLQLKLKCGESVRQWLGTRVGGQSQVMLKSALVGWRDLVATSRQARMMEELKGENLAYRAKTNESMRWAMSVLVGGQASSVVREAFTDGSMCFRN